MEHLDPERKGHNAFLDEVRVDLLGFRGVPHERTVDWARFFDTPGATPAQRSKKIDGKLVRALIALPVAVSGECEIKDYHSRGRP